MNRLIIAVVALIAALYVLVSSLFVVNEREQAIVLRFGAIDRVITEPGIYFKVPTNFVDSVQIIEDRLLRYDLANMRVQVSGGAFYVVDAFLTYRITDPRLFRQAVNGDLGTAERRIATRFDAALRQVYGLRGFNAALSEQRPQMMAEARDLIRPDMAALGINVVDVRILRTDLTPEVSNQTYERMKAERLAEAAFLRAQGQEAAQSLRAIADRQAAEIVAAARRDSEIARGQGDAERNRIFAQAYAADPEFFEFYRSLQSYRTALASSGTTLVLSPDSEFFRYFNETGDIAPTRTNGIAPAGAEGAAPAGGDPAAAAGTEPAGAEAAGGEPTNTTPLEPAGGADTAPADPAAGTATMPADPAAGPATTPADPAAVGGTGPTRPDPAAAAGTTQADPAAAAGAAPADPAALPAATGTATPAEPAAGQ